MRKHGFTLVEIMIVVAVIGILLAISIPAYQKSRRNAQITRFMNDVRVAANAFITYSIENGDYPPDVTPSVMPSGMDEYLTKMDWAGTTPLGGRWDWDLGQFGHRAGVSVYRPSWSASDMVTVDERIDDGDLRTGEFRQRSQGYIYLIE